MTAEEDIFNVGLLECLHRNILKSLNKLSDDFENDNNLLTLYSLLEKHSTDIQLMRQKVYRKPRFEDFDEELHQTDRKIQNLIYQLEAKIASLYKEEVLQKKVFEDSQRRVSQCSNLPILPKSGSDFESGETIESLKSRLLSTTHNQLDQVQTTEIQNNYHESLQQEIIESLPTMVSSLKEQASQFQEMIMHDANILKEATQNFEASQNKFDGVNNLLSKYHKEGKLSYWFYIRVTAMIVVCFMILLIIIRLIPARH